MTEVTRISPQLRTVLSIIHGAPGEAHHGFEICKAASMDSGTVHPMLKRLEAAGWLTSEWEDNSPFGRPMYSRRHLYRLTEKGTREAARVLAANPDGTRRRHPDIDDTQE
jgi:PadR family transcriptional regulator, regulatory protein PadR